jgi:hypothetical protein
MTGYKRSPLERIQVWHIISDWSTASLRNGFTPSWPSWLKGPWRPSGSHSLHGWSCCGPLPTTLPDHSDKLLAPSFAIEAPGPDYSGKLVPPSFVIEAPGRITQIHWKSCRAKVPVGFVGQRCMELPEETFVQNMSGASKGVVHSVKNTTHTACGWAWATSTSAMLRSEASEEDYMCARCLLWSLGS